MESLTNRDKAIICFFLDFMGYGFIPENGWLNRYLSSLNECPTNSDIGSLQYITLQKQIDELQKEIANARFKKYPREDK